MKSKLFVGVLAVILVALFSGNSFSQQTTASIQPGVISLIEGKVAINGKEISLDSKSLYQMKEGDKLDTQSGRAEILLAPGIFLRVDEQTSIELVANRLLNTRLEVKKGSVLLECLELVRYNEIRLGKDSTSALIKKYGLYRFDAKDIRLRVYSGELEVTLPTGAKVVAKNKKEVSLSAGNKANKFNAKEMDDLMRWSSIRAEFISAASTSAVRIFLARGVYPYWNSSMWFWNPYFNSFGYLPYGGGIRSYYGPRYYSYNEVQGRGSNGGSQAQYPASSRSSAPSSSASSSSGSVSSSSSSVGATERQPVTQTAPMSSPGPSSSSSSGSTARPPSEKRP